MTASLQAYVPFLQGAGVVLLVLGGAPESGITQPSPAETPPPRLLRTTAISLHTPPVILQHQEVWVVVRVQTRRGQPVPEQLVELSIDAPATAYARVEPQRVVTQQGVARARLRADLIGVVHMTARIGLRTTRARIKVMLPLARPVLPETTIRRQAFPVVHLSLLTPEGRTHDRTTGHPYEERRAKGCDGIGEKGCHMPRDSHHALHVLRGTRRDAQCAQEVS